MVCLLVWTGIESLNGDSQKIVNKWAKNKKKNDDPLLLIEWDEVGLVLRNAANQLHTKLSLVNGMSIIINITLPIIF